MRAKIWQPELELTSEFKHWLAGFIAGEGCFRVQYNLRSGTSPYCSCNFTLKQRDDNSAILKEIVKRTKIGRLKTDTSGRSNPCLVWCIDTKASTLALVDILDQVPLRTIKANDYRIWREAVIYWQTMPRGSRWYGPRDYTTILAYKKAIEEAREYR